MLISPDFRIYPQEHKNAHPQMFHQFCGHTYSRLRIYALRIGKVRTTMMHFSAPLA
ncbi:MAG: hypothetical protein FWF63_07580 [Fibromonadales bacterium]|nr:hypothetical protein [Fibromonadales bacterium]